MKKLIIFLVCTAAIALYGCANEQHTREYVQTGTESVNQISKSIIGAKRAELADDPAILDTYEKDIDNVIAQQRTLFAQLKQEIEQEKQQREALVSALGSIAIEALPAGSSAIQVAKAIGFKINTAEDNAIKATNEKTKEVETTANDNKKVIAALSVTTDGIAKDTKILESRIANIETSTDELLEEKYAVRTDFAVAKERFNSLSTSMQEKLSQVPESVIQDLTKLKADDEAFRDKLQRELQITDAQMESLKGLSTEEILGLLAAAGVATGAGGALAKTGKSRGSAEIENLRKDILELKYKKGGTTK